MRHAAAAAQQCRRAINQHNYKTPRLTLLVIIICTVLGLAGTDLVLPAVPTLPTALGGSVALSQMVLATFVAGGACGLLLFGALGASVDQRWLMIAAMVGYGLVSLLATQVDALGELVALRFAQGLFSAAPAVFAPGIIRVMFDERGAIKAIGILSSIESLTPALAPIAGVWLLHVAGWQASFSVIAVLAAVLSVVLILLRSRIPNVHPTRQGAGYVSLLANAVFMRYALSQALTLGALLVFVFGAPAVITLTMGGTLTHFIIMQVCGIATFIIGASSAERFVGRFGAETMIWFGSTLSLLGIVLITGYALLGFNDPRWLALLFVPMNFGLGLRGPPGFLSAVLAADGDDARGSALVILFVLLVTAGGTAFAAPLVDDGLRALALVSVGLSALSLLVLWVLPKRNV